jgi:hypothetical protein
MTLQGFEDPCYDPSCGTREALTGLSIRRMVVGDAPQTACAPSFGAALDGAVAKYRHSRKQPQEEQNYGPQRSKTCVLKHADSLSR